MKTKSQARVELEITLIQSLITKMQVHHDEADAVPGNVEVVRDYGEEQHHCSVWVRTEAVKSYFSATDMTLGV